MTDHQHEGRAQPTPALSDWEAPRVTILEAGSAEQNFNITPDGAGSGFS
jgi:hypothetical protein